MLSPRRLPKFEPALRGAMKASGFLTRDSRVVERKVRPGWRPPPLPVLEALIGASHVSMAGLIVPFGGSRRGSTGRPSSP